MRCPKCGFISFDHVDACLKCSKDISKVTSKLEGTTYNVAAPSFLKFQASTGVAETDKQEISFDHTRDEFDVVDPDLDVLVDDISGGGQESDEGGISFGDDLDGFDTLGEDDGLDLDSEADDEGLDLGQFEDAFEDQEGDLSGGDIQMNLPDELADLSDLSPPSEEDDDSDMLPPMDDKEELGDFSLNLDLDELGDDFSLTEKADQPSDDDTGLDDLSLDDLGLSDKEEEVAVEDSLAEDDMDMDADLDFDLDLGGISLNKED